MVAVNTGITQPSPIQRLSRVLAIACLFAMLTSPIYTVWLWLAADPSTLVSEAKLSFVVREPLLAWQRGAGMLAALLPVGCQIMGQWQARKCFQLFADGQIFIANAVHFLRRFAGWMIATIFAQSVSNALHSVVLSFGNPSGERMLTIELGVSWDSLLSIIMVWVMAAVIGHGQALAEENAKFI